jgi:hypothetical protein
VSRRRSLSSQLYSMARTTNTVEALLSGDPNRIARRSKNIILGRALGRAGLWRALWR